MKLKGFFLVMIGLVGMMESSNAQMRKRVSEFNKLSLEVQGGFDVPFQPRHMMLDGEKANINEYRAYGGQFGARYMFNSFLGIRAHYGYHHFYTTVANVGTFLRFHRYAGELVLSTAEFAEARHFYNPRKWNLLLHAGAGLTHGFPSSLFRKEGYTGYMHEDIYSFMFGVTPQYRINSQFTAYAAMNLHLSTRQNFGYHGRFLPESVPDAQLGIFLNTSVGISYSLGRKAEHIDWR